MKKKSIPDGETCFNKFYDICKELGINDENEETELELGNGFTVIPIANKKNRFFANQIQSKETAAPNPKCNKKGDATNTAKRTRTKQKARSSKAIISQATDFTQDPEIPFNDNLPGQIDFSDLPGVIPEEDEV